MGGGWRLGSIVPPPQLFSELVRPRVIFFPSIWKVLSHRRVQTWLSFQFWGKITCKKGGKININRVNASAAGKYFMRNKGLIKAKWTYTVIHTSLPWIWVNVKSFRKWVKLRECVYSPDLLNWRPLAYLPLSELPYSLCGWFRGITFDTHKRKKGRVHLRFH